MSGEGEKRGKSNDADEDDADAGEAAEVDVEEHETALAAARSSSIDTMRELPTGCQKSKCFTEESKDRLAMTEESESQDRDTSVGTDLAKMPTCGSS